MQQKKKLLTAGVMIAAAAVTAHLMQRTGDPASRGMPPASASAGMLAVPSPAPAAAEPAVFMPVAEAAPATTPEAAPPVELAAATAEPAMPAQEAAVADLPPETAPDATAEIVTAEAEPPTRDARPFVPGPANATPEAQAETPALAAELSAPDQADESDATAIVETVSLDEAPEAAAPTATLALAPEIPSDAAIPDPLDLPQPSPQDRLGGAETPLPEDVAEPPAHSEYGLACDVILSASARPAAMVRLMITAPCRAQERVTVRHAGLIFSARMDALGTYVADIPALEADATFDVSFEDGAAADTAVDVPAAARIERVALEYNGPTGLQIHALEFGADYGDPGHIWAGNTSAPDVALKKGGGFLTSLGDPTLPDAFLAEVYTLPADASGRDGVVRLNVEAEVTPENCGHDVAGQTIQRQAGGGMRPVSLTLSMPDCDAVGEFLVLKNLLRDLKIASY